MAKQSQDIRLAATTRIWGLTVGILTICIPLSAVTRSGSILPLAAIGGAAVATIAVWRFDEKRLQTKYLQQQQVELLEQRIANLETIVSTDDYEVRIKLQQLKASDAYRNPPNISTTSKQSKRKA
ncbi:hypothetical protein FNW02_09310 [Komarekiella sp. 'clone 1']|uniref:Uncharacterized protein n=1 Tax=Komarekiella delphini-convector SJRDD-AB1 TaxID=2593771 RepID=A0AA40VQJ4_9NOST|nr:hypothetical protein [Komarekiella delphini-convector]MBD6616020.1 hypothetical protein [Komarekiella delphini-convector SJRDD-AB1]